MPLPAEGWGHIAFHRDVTSIASLINFYLYIQIYIGIYICVCFGDQNLGTFYHYENRLIQMYWKFQHQNLKVFK